MFIICEELNGYYKTLETGKQISDIENWVKGAASGIKGYRKYLVASFKNRKAKPLFWYIVNNGLYHVEVTKKAEDYMLSGYYFSDEKTK